MGCDGRGGDPPISFIERPGTWNYGHQFLAGQPVETKSAVPGAPNELSLYATESYWTDNSSEIRRYTLPFASS